MIKICTEVWDPVVGISKAQISELHSDEEVKPIQQRLRCLLTVGGGASPKVYLKKCRWVTLQGRQKGAYLQKMQLEPQAGARGWLAMPN